MVETDTEAAAGDVRRHGENFYGGSKEIVCMACVFLDQR